MVDETVLGGVVFRLKSPRERGMRERKRRERKKREERAKKKRVGEEYEKTLYNFTSLVFQLEP